MMKLYQVAVFYLFKRFGKLNEILIKTILEWVQVLSYEFFLCVCAPVYSLQFEIQKFIQFSPSLSLQRM